MLLSLAVATSACGPAGPSGTPLTTDQLKDPEQCKSCHPNQYAQWSGSMHAYAAEDPIFRAMNQRGQRETNGALGSFCIGCHAPVAVQSGLTTDGLNIDSVPKAMRGITCFFCHSVESVAGDHNNPLKLAADGVLRAGIADPMATAAHPSAYSTLHDRQGKESASLCGSCHDIVTPANVALERTYQEWQGSVYSKDDPKKPTQLQTCGKCHMSGSQGTASNVGGSPARLVHDHTFDGVDSALIDWPQKDAQQAAIARDLYTSLSARLCVMPNQADTTITVTLDNVAVGHDFPSGAGQDRRAWVQLIATLNGAKVYSSGEVAPGQAVVDLKDPDLWLMRDEIFDKSMMPVHMFWQVASYQAKLLGPSVTNDPGDPRYFHSVTHTYTVSGKLADDVKLTVKLQPIGIEVLKDLVASGDLDPSYVDKMGTMDLGSTVLEWKAANGYGCVPQ